LFLLVLDDDDDDDDDETDFVALDLSVSLVVAVVDEDFGVADVLDSVCIISAVGRCHANDDGDDKDPSS